MTPIRETIALILDVPSTRPRPRSRTHRAGAQLPRRAGVTIFLVMSDTLPLAEVKAKFSEMVDRVEHQHDRITVTRNGRPAAVLVSPDDLASLEETLELLSNSDAVAEIEFARAEVRAAKVVSADELRAKYLTK